MTTSLDTPELELDRAREELLTSIYRDHYDRVRRIALRYGGGNAAWAEDVTQDVFFKLVDKLDTLDDPARPGPWLSRVTVNRCLNKLQRERTWRDLMPTWLHTAPRESRLDPELLAGARESVRRAWTMAQQLPAKERAAFFMHRVDEMTQEEVAQTLGFSKGYVNKLIKRAEARLAARGWRPDDD